MYYKKTYVAILARVDTEGKIKPLAVEWNDGRLYEIDRILDERNALPPHVGAYLTRKYKVLISGREKCVFYETESGKWFVEERAGNS